MPPNLMGGDHLRDDFVAQVLANEARDSSKNYSVQGMGAYMPKRPTGAAPKPNTRFLRHIIKETDTHNAALKRKEEREARERMRQLRNQTTPSSHDTREQRRHHQSDERDPRRDRREDREDKHRSHRRRHRSRSASANRERSSKHRRRHQTYHDDGESRHGSSRKSRRHRSYSRSRSRSPKEDRDDTRSRHRRYRRRSRSRSPESRRNKDSQRSGRHGSREREAPKRSAATSKEPTSSHPPSTLSRPSGYESDPLEDLVGPLPAKNDGLEDIAPIRSRGRGAYKPNISNIDAHFAPDYDPTTDVQLEDDDNDAGNKPTRRPVAGLMTKDDDWDTALEALRDRARWRQRGEERLREAGFNDDFVERWKGNTSTTAGDTENKPEDVKWSKKGEGREWDRGKFVNDEGHIDIKASW